MKNSSNTLYKVLGCENSCLQPHNHNNFPSLKYMQFTLYTKHTASKFIFVSHIATFALPQLTWDGRTHLQMLDLTKATHCAFSNLGKHVFYCYPDKAHFLFKFEEFYSTFIEFLELFSVHHTQQSSQQHTTHSQRCLYTVICNVPAVIFQSLVLCSPLIEKTNKETVFVMFPLYINKNFSILMGFKINLSPSLFGSSTLLHKSCLSACLVNIQKNKNERKKLHRCLL